MKEQNLDYKKYYKNISPIQKNLLASSSGGINKARVSGIYEGELDIEAVKRRFNRIVSQHQVLQIIENEQNKNQPFLSQEILDVEVIDLQAVPKAECNKKIAQISKQILHAKVPIYLHVILLESERKWLMLSASCLSVDYHSLCSILSAVLDAEHPLNLQKESEVVAYEDVAEWLQSIKNDPENMCLTNIVNEDTLTRFFNSKLGISSYLNTETSYQTRKLNLDTMLPNITEIAHRYKCNLEQVVSSAIRMALRKFTPEVELAHYFSCRDDEDLLHVIGPLENVIPIHVQHYEDLNNAVASETLARKHVEGITECLYKPRRFNQKPYLYSFASQNVEMPAQFEIDTCYCISEASQIQFLFNHNIKSCELLIHFDTQMLNDTAINLIIREIEHVLTTLNNTRQEKCLSGDVFNCDYQNVITWSKQVFRTHPHSNIVDQFGKATTFLEFEQDTAKLSHYLLNQGVVSGSKVVIWMNRSIDFLKALYSVLATGATYIPLDGSVEKGRAESIIEQLNPELILTDVPHLEINQRVRTTAFSEIDLSAYSPNFITPNIRKSDLAYIIFTSGSTGEPKGVQMSHGALLNHMSWMINEFQFGPADTILQRTNGSFDASIWECWAPLLSGANCVVSDTSMNYAPDELIAIIKSHKVNILQVVPSFLELLLAFDNFNESLELKSLFCGGEQLKTNTARQAMGSLKCDIFNLYGPTECCIDTTFFKFDPALNSDVVPIGKPIYNLQCMVLNANNEIVGPGQIGELLVGGESLFEGYFDRPEQTKNALFFDNSGNRYYKTGDIVQVLFDGTIVFIERKDNQVQVNGYRVELPEISKTAESFSGCERAHCIYDETNKGLILFVIGDNNIDVSKLNSHLKSTLPAYMMPEYTLLVDEFAVNPNGKIDETVLLNIARKKKQQQQYVAPVTDLEKKLVHIWSEILGQTKPIGVNDNFHSLGGDSILGIKVVYEASRQGVEFTIVELFKHSTIAELSREIEVKANTEYVSLVESVTETREQKELLERFEDAYPATGMQTFMLRQYERDHARLGMFHPQEVINVDTDEITMEALEKAINGELFSANFRTRFVESNDDIYQVIVPFKRLSITHVIVENEKQLNEEVRKTLEHDRYLPFNWRNIDELLIRIYLLESKDGVGKIVMSNLHAIQDGWGNIEFKNNVLRRIQDYQNDDRSENILEQNVPKEFSIQEQSYNRDPAIESYWIQKSEQFETSRWEYSTFGCETIQQRLFSLDPDDSQALQKGAELLGVHAKSLYLVVLLNTVKDVFGEDRASAGLVTNGRNASLSDPLGAKGLFWNLIPFKLNGKSNLIENIKATQDELFALENYVRISINKLFAMNEGKVPFWLTFNYVHFHNRTYDVPKSEPAMQDRIQSTDDLNIKDYFGFPLEFSIAVNQSQVRCLINFNPNVINSSDINGFIKCFHKKLKALKVLIEEDVHYLCDVG
ncbi:amino acid adenylation domain-containing protein [Pseudoalteromonas sp. MMG007]|uniref:non-ribosomal peptide synthetase n=1 Tax=Pseudoalteromonas sp. MMG007 TaxID=2822684 RepID=UPI001B364717|nr:amino acid adenylation domain-containing protein [Pseudoalteromonas sp. MMG007]MBQ4860001.1 amino acid adenylation domain-containing protein [Pseudoalteromonas sp. MMG007]